LCCARTIAWRSLRLQSTFSTSLCNMKQQDCSELRYHTAKRRYAINGSRCRKLSSFHAATAGLCSDCLSRATARILTRMGTKSRETIYGASVRAAAERATEARKEADRLAVAAWNKRMLGFQGPAQPSPALGDALNAGYCYLEVKCLGCNTHQTVALDIVRRPKATPVHELERYMRCKDCSEVRGYPYKRSHLVALRATKISANDPPSTWWPGER